MILTNFTLIRMVSLNADCDCYKYLLEAMSRWEGLEKQVNRLTQENQLLRQLLTEKQNVAMAGNFHARSGSTVEKSSSIPDFDPGYSNLNTQRRFTSHALPTVTSVNKENEKKFNLRLDKISKNMGSENQDEKPQPQTMNRIKMHRNPSMDEFSLRNYVAPSYTSVQKEGPLTERSSYNSTLGTRDTNRDRSSLLSTRTFTYKARNW